MKTYTNLDEFYADYPEPYQESDEVQTQEVVLLKAALHQSNIARFFAHLCENISILTEEFDLDLTTIHTLEFTPHIGGPGWWLDVDEDQFIWIRRDYSGACEVVFNGYRSDYEEMYAQAQEVVS